MYKATELSCTEMSDYNYRLIGAGQLISVALHRARTAQNERTVQLSPFLRAKAATAFSAS